MKKNIDSKTGCLKGYGEHDYSVINTHRNNIKSCINCGQDEPLINLDDGNCFVCHKKTNSLSCNPSEWGIFLAHIDGQQKHRHYHVKCLYPILRENKNEK